jgi:hypothetical protein
MDKARRKKLTCFQKTRTRVIKKTLLTVTTTVTATSMVISILALEELVNFIDVAVASKYGIDLMNFTHTITEEVGSTLDTFKTNLQNMLLRQIRSLV